MNSKLASYVAITLYCDLIQLCRYLGGLRLLQATCKKFYHYCVDHGYVNIETVSEAN